MPWACQCHQIHLNTVRHILQDISPIPAGPPAGREEHCSARGGGGGTEAHLPLPPPPPLCRRAGRGGRPAVPPGGGGGEASTAQNDPHVVLIILTTQTGGGGGVVEKKFWATICVPAPTPCIRCVPQNKGPGAKAHFSPPLPPPAPSAGLPAKPPPPAQSHVQAALLCRRPCSAAYFLLQKMALCSSGVWCPSTRTWRSRGCFITRFSQLS